MGKMRRFSRWMPQMPPKPLLKTLVGLVVLAGLLVTAVAAAVAWPVPVGVCLGALLVYTLVGIFYGSRHQRRLAAERKDEHIGSFARAFDRRKEPFDPWVVRATWDALKPYVGFPLRATDRIEKDLGVVGDDFGEIVVEVAARSGRSLDEMKTLEGVETIGDLVRLITIQPRSRL